jgi:hypothetical protein
MGEMSNAYEICCCNTSRRDHLEDQGKDGEEIIMYIKGIRGRVWTGFTWFCIPQRKAVVNTAVNLLVQ